MVREQTRVGRVSVTGRGRNRLPKMENSDSSTVRYPRSDGRVVA